MDSWRVRRNIMGTVTLLGFIYTVIFFLFAVVAMYKVIKESKQKTEVNNEIKN